MTRALTLLLTISLIACSKAEDEKPSKPKVDDVAAKASAGHKWAEWVEPDFPFFSSVLDARDVGETFPKDNLTPRGLILNLGNNLWACFDTDLLRIACIWQGEEGKPPVTPEALAPGSYHIAGQKTKDGQDFLPKPNGKVLLANGIYPGWQVLKSASDKPSFMDPREPTPSKEEVGRGPESEKLGRLISVEARDKGARLRYRVGGIDVAESIQYGPWAGRVIRAFVAEPHADTWALCIGHLRSVPHHKGEIKLSVLPAAGEKNAVESSIRVFNDDE
jgi:hypothetical protein